MINLSVMDMDRVSYVEHVRCFWKILETQGAEQANRETEQSAAIAKRWAGEGCITEFLTPLLAHESESVRYAAAADLLNCVSSEAAIATLRDIADNPRGLIAPTAKLFLMKRRLPLRRI